LQIEFQRDLDKMEDNLRLLQDNFNNYGLDFFVNGSRKPKHAAVYEKTANTEDKLMSQF